MNIREAVKVAGSILVVQRLSNIRFVLFEYGPVCSQLLCGRLENMSLVPLDMKPF